MPALLIPMVNFLLTTVAPMVIGWFATDAQAKAAALADFYSAIQQHANDGLISAQEALSAAQQQADLIAQASLVKLREAQEAKDQAIAAKAIQPKD